LLNAVAVKSIQNYLRKSCSALAPKVLANMALESILPIDNWSKNIGVWGVSIHGILIIVIWRIVIAPSVTRLGEISTFGYFGILLT
jgi:hypothetical protein